MNATALEITTPERIRYQPAPNAVVAATPMDMLNKAIERGASIEVIGQMMTLYERWNAAQGRKAFDEAMAAAKAEIPVVFKNKKVDFTSAKGRTNYQYEDLAEIARTVDPILAKHGLSYRFRPAQDGAMVTVTCIVSHRDGYSEENTLSAGKDESGNKNSIQAVGSTATYLQRYTLKMALGISASSDDDGKASSQAEPAGPISPDQVTAIRALIEETETDIAKFCAYLNIEAIPDISASEFKRVISMLEKKRVAK